MVVDSSKDKDTYHGGDGKLLLLSVLEETQDVITGDDTGFAGELIDSTHSEDGLYGLSRRGECIR